MPPRNLLLITGSRVLADRDDAAQWSKELLAQFIDTLTAGDIVLAGGARGPDTWAVQRARERKIKTIEFRLDAGRYENEKHVGHWCNPALRDLTDPRQWPLDRNVALVQAAIKAQAAGWSVRTLALRASWSPTQGTTHTAFQCETSGIEVKEHVFNPNERRRFDVVWVDTETSGLGRGHSIIEIGAVHVDSTSRKLIRSFETKIKPPPGIYVSAETAAINGYDEQLWVDAPESKRGIELFLEWLPAEPFVYAGYNTSFDKRWIQQACVRYGLLLPKWHGTAIDPLFKVRETLRKRGKIQNAKLDTVCDHLGIYNATRHRALADAERARLVYLALLGQKPEGSLFDAIRDSDAHSIP